MRSGNFDRLDPAQCLVVACGDHHDDCHRHWLSLDINPLLQPTLVRSIDEVNQSDFKDTENSTGKFDLVYAEGISGSINLLRLLKLYQLTTNNGSVLIEPCNYELLKKVPLIFQIIKGIINGGTWLLLLKDESQIEKTVNTITHDLHPSPMFKRIADEVKKLMNEYEGVHPLLLCAIAHLNTYLQERESRFFKNPFKNDLYRQEIGRLKTKILQLDGMIITTTELNAVNQLMTDIRRALPSTRKSKHVITYTPLAHILDTCESCIKNFASDAISKSDLHCEKSRKKL